MSQPQTTDPPVTPVPPARPTVPVECRRLTKSFGDETAVDNLSFEVAAGSITGFVGANGAGKTTTMRMLLGLVSPTAGDAFINGQPYRELVHPRHQVGAVLDGPGAHPRHTARTHLKILATSAGVHHRRVSEVLRLTDLAEHDGKRVGQFSLGMRQRLALAGALLGDPAVLLLDEPVNGLDPRGILWMRDLLRRLADDGHAILVSSHLLAELAEIADRVVIIDGGRLVADAAIEDLMDGRSLEDVYLDLAGSVGGASGDGGAGGPTATSRAGDVESEVA